MMKRPGLSGSGASGCGPDVRSGEVPKDEGARDGLATAVIGVVRAPVPTRGEDEEVHEGGDHDDRDDDPEDEPGSAAVGVGISPSRRVDVDLAHAALLRVGSCGGSAT